ncbi:hypothetical protein BGZ83_001517, partial [Gryganskiella cystojenkinii]
MLGRSFSSSRIALSPQKELELAFFYLEHACKNKDREIALALCDDAEAALCRMKRAAKKTPATPLSVEDQAQRCRIADAYFKHSDILANLGHMELAKASYKKAKKWEYVTYPVPAISSAAGITGRDIAFIPDSIFPDDMRQSVASCTLPGPDERLINTAQLAYSLGLLQITPSPGEEFETAAGNWLKAMENNEEEKDRLKTLGIDVIRAFSIDGLKDAKAVAEVLCLAPVLQKEYFQLLLKLFVDGVDKSSLLDVHSLEGLAQLVQTAPEGYLDSDDLATILHNLNTRLQDTHGQSSDHIYHLTSAVSNVLDAMADTKVSGVKRVELHEPLSAYLNGLQGSSDPYLVYQAAYAFQALQCVPDNESPWQATMRRAGIVVKGVSGLVSAVKGLDVNGFMEGLSHLQEGLGEVIQVAKIGYEGVSSLVEGGRGLLESLKVGLSFDRKRAWYAALRGADTLLRDGQLSKFKTLVCRAPCRRDVAFQLGVCQRLGNIAANTQWDAESRQGALVFLGEIYRNDAVWGQQALVKQWILHILMQLASTFGSALPSVESLLQELELSGDDAKRSLYLDCRKKVRSSYTLKVILPTPSSPSLLDRVQNKTDVEADLRRLRKQRPKERVYIPTQAKATLMAPDDALFPLMDKVKEFLSSNEKVMLILGNSGAGKSTFNRALEAELWASYKKKDGRIPLFINLPAIDKPEQDLIAKHLRKAEFTEPQIRELKDYRKFILICDGYDESQQTHNLYTSNQLNLEQGWSAQMIISCRTEYLGVDFQDRFQPADRSSQEQAAFQAIIAPFSMDQIQDYIGQYVSVTRPLWEVKDYLKALDQIPSLRELVKNPFMLTLALEVLPRMVGAERSFSGVRVTRVALYDQFVEQWLEQGKKRLVEKKDLSYQEKKVFESLSDDGFAQNGVAFLKALAVAIYKEQAGNPVVEYSPFRDQTSWKNDFFSREEDKQQLLREACPLTRSGNQYRFIHKSLLEYCLARAVFEPRNTESVRCSTSTHDLPRRGSVHSVMSFENQDDRVEPAVPIEHALLDSPLAGRIFVGEPSILHFLVERVQQEPLFKQQLLAMIELSKFDKKARKAAANAITILVRAGVRFNGANLKDVQIPGADLSGGQFDSAQLQGADLRKVNLRSIWMRQANLSDARMSGVQFGEWPYLKEYSSVYSCTYSSVGRRCAVGLDNGTINVYDTTTSWVKIHTVHGHTDRVYSVAYSPSSQQIASGSSDKTVRLWNAQTGAPGPILSGHTGIVYSVTYSPSGQQIASGSRDWTVRLWDAQTGAPGHILSGHIGVTRSVTYSPSGHQIASGSEDMTVRLWDAQTGVPGPVLSGHTGSVRSVTYSPSGLQIASGSEDSTVRLWDAQTGALAHILSGHTTWVYSVSYSPSGQQIASGSEDKTVRLWDAQTGVPGPILSGHTATVRSVIYSPSGHQIASGSYDNTVRLWDSQTSASRPILNCHTDTVNSVTYSPSGQQIASGSDDHTARLWDVQTGASGPILRGHIDRVRSVTYSPSSHQIASGSSDSTVRLWDAQTGAPGPVLNGHTSSVYSVTYSPSGLQIASGSSDRTVRLWDAQSGAPGLTLYGHTDEVWSVAYSPSGHKIASGSDDKTVRLWDVQTGASGPIFSGHTNCVSSVTYSPSGRQIASGSLDKTVRIWDAQTGAPGPILSGHTGNVYCVTYSPSGQQIASGSDDYTARLWCVDSGQCLVVVEDFHRIITSITWNATINGAYFATGYGKFVRTWKLVEEEDHYQARLHW